jgi:hypothetical protein
MWSRRVSRRRFVFRSARLYSWDHAEASHQKMYEWRITRIRSTPAALIGYVEAPVAAQAIKEAIRAFGITDPEQQKRLAAVAVKEIKRA